MFALQSYLEEKPVYDGNAYAFSSTLVGGTLTLYAHHITAPVSPAQRPDHHTTQLKAYALTGDDDVWLEGTGAFRNLRVLAKGLRDRFITNANPRARKRNTEAAANAGDLVEEQPGSSPLDFYDCRMFAEPGDDDQETQMSHAGLASIDDVDDATASTTFATSFTPSFTSVSREEPLRSPRQPKMPRNPPLSFLYPAHEAWRSLATTRRAFVVVVLAHARMAGARPGVTGGITRAFSTSYF